MPKTNILQMQDLRDRWHTRTLQKDLHRLVRELVRTRHCPLPSLAKRHLAALVNWFTRRGFADIFDCASIEEAHAWIIQRPDRAQGEAADSGTVNMACDDFGDFPADDLWYP
jgi:hypothetical protein